MGTSKIRGTIPAHEGDLSVPPDADLHPWFVMTQPVAGKPHISAGWLDAVDPAMAMQFARHHYGRDQKVESIWAMPREAMIETEEEATALKGAERTDWRLVTQENDASVLIDAGSIANCGPVDAWAEAATRAAKIPNLHSFWIIDERAILRTDADDLVWPLTDQSYRLARGYSKRVRQKWDALRTSRDLTEYRKDDLKDTF